MSPKRIAIIVLVAFVAFFAASFALWRVNVWLAGGVLSGLSGINTEPEIIQLYYYNEQNDLDENRNILCSSRGLMAVDRDVESANPIDAVRLLLEGNLTDEERQSGITTEFPFGSAELLSKSELGESGVLRLVFADPQHETSGGSCRVNIMQAQIVQTALQFEEVQDVLFLPNEVFQP